MQASPIPCEGDVNHLNAELSHYSKRFEHIMKASFDPVFETEMLTLMDAFSSALTSTNFTLKETLLENYMQPLNALFKEYLEIKLDEQYLNQEIRIMEWYFRQLLPQLEPHLAVEVAEFLPLYQRALDAPQFNDKYDLYANIEENFSKDLLALWEGESENIMILNTQLLFLKDFLFYLLKAENLIMKYERELRALLSKIETALNDDQLREKFDIIHLFDDIEHPFGHFLDCMMYDFVLFQFG